MHGTNVRARYDRLREMAYAAAEDVLNDMLDNGDLDSLARTYRYVRLKLTSIDDMALEAWEEQWAGHPDRRFDWDWRSERRAWDSNLSRFEVAVWSDDHLCGLAIGKISKGREHLAIYILEGSPDNDHPLKQRVRHCVVEAAEAYAVTTGCKRLYLLNPLEGALQLYLQMGFSLAKTKAKVVACVKELSE
jgi:hypothetical protein